MSNTKKENNFHVFNLKFVDIKAPEIKEDKRKGYVTFGRRNEYPSYLLDMMQQSAKHNAIVRGKTDFIIGKGFEIANPIVDEKTGQAKEYKFLTSASEDGETLTEVGLKVVHDVEGFGGAYVELIFEKGGKLKFMNHLDFVKVRASKDLSNFYYAAEGWSEKRSDGEFYSVNKVDYKEIPAYDTTKKQASAILFIREYTPGMDVYPLPGYIGSLRYIAVDIAISEYHLNGITNGMFSSKMISFNNGVPEEEDQEEVERKVNGKFAGQKNAGKIMVNFSRGKENEPTILDLSGTEIDKQFDLLNKTVQQEIFSGHRVTTPMIFGIKTEGQLGGRTELREAFELFNNTYLEAKRTLIEKYFNVVLIKAGIPEVKLQRSEPIGFEFDAATLADNMTEDEIRATRGLAPRDEASGIKGLSKIVKRLNALPEAVANKIIDKLTPDELRAIIGLPPLPGGDNIEGETDSATAPPAKVPPAQGGTFADESNDDEDAEVFAGFGSERALYDVYESRQLKHEDALLQADGNFAEVADVKGNKLAVLDLLTKDPKIDAKAIAGALDITEGRATAILADLEKSGLLKVTESGEGVDKTVTRKPNKDAKDIINKGGNEDTLIKVLYSYEGPQDDRNRPFCKKILELNRLYSRVEIEAISAKVGYSVWHRRGGWYRKPGASEASPSCRHTWSANVVIEKKQK